MTSQPTRTQVDTLARALCDADVYVNDGDYPGWDDLSKTPGLGQDEVRKAARWLLARFTFSERPEDLPAGFSIEACVTVSCAVCGYGYDEDEFIQHFNTVAQATDEAVGAGWDKLKDSRVLCESHDEAHDALRAEIGVVDPDAEDSKP